VRLDDTVAAIATPAGRGAVAIVRVSGDDVPHLTARLVRAKVPLRPRVATYATIVDEDGRALDRGLAIAFPPPRSYTGEAMLELQIHGSPVVAREIVRALLVCGARLAEPGEFTRRAFLNGKMDLHAAAAVADVIAAETRSAARAAVANLGGGLADEVRRLRSSLAGLLEELTGAIDFPEEVPAPEAARLEAALAPIVARLEQLRRDGEVGRLMREGLQVAIVGPPNAGKSSLLNALLGEERAIVSEIPGTTRDTIEESIAIDGVPIRLVDTAGIRAHADRIESDGIARTERALSAARIALVVIDGSQPLTGEAQSVLERTRGRERVLFLNKADLGEVAGRELADPEAIAGSVRDVQTLRRLRERIARLGWGGEGFDLERPHLASLRELDAAGEAHGALARALHTLEIGDPSDFITGELQRAFSALGHVSEQVGAEEIVDGIFARFCIGK
jgi:tRNA modification GTPase